MANETSDNLGDGPSERTPIFASENLNCTYEQEEAGRLEKTKTKRLSLTQLPMEILDNIIQYLHQPELICFCLVSKYLYWPTLKRLYRQITIVYDWRYRLERIPMQPSNYFTIVREDQMEMFLATLRMNQDIASFVQTINIAESDDFLDISSYLDQLLSHVRLRSFHCAEEIDVPQNILQTVQSLSSDLNPQLFRSHSDLVELRIFYQGAHSDMLTVGELALGMIKSNSYHKLKKLSFKNQYYNDDYERFEGSENSSDGNFHNQFWPLWAEFFLVFSEEDIKLNLTDLRIESEFWDDLDDVTADVVEESVQLNKLENLELKFSHYIRRRDIDPHEYGVHAFLEKVTRKTPSLQYLSITHTDTCSEKEINGLARVLGYNIPLQLRNLRVVLEDQFNVQLERRRLMILGTQGNLIKLKFSHCSNCQDEDDGKFNGVPGLFDFDFEALYSENIGKILSPSIFDYDEYRYYIHEEIFNSLINHFEEVIEFLFSDSIYCGADYYLPFLTEYSVIGLSINMKQRCIYINNRGLLLEK
ncbi:hypothetical protein JCM33374_g3089 [Metschnikowia sp. JCM 33374]|nr:hypothetical protein JCM33374_g3089 [Metschnikowia sp. JCM 33374]